MILRSTIVFNWQPTNTNVVSWCSDFGVEDKLLGYAERAGQSSLQGSIPGVWGRLQNLWYL
jgi:hypothetical protein